MPENDTTRNQFWYVANKSSNETPFKEYNWEYVDIRLRPEAIPSGIMEAAKHFAAGFMESIIFTFPSKIYRCDFH